MFRIDLFSDVLIYRIYAAHMKSDDPFVFDVDKAKQLFSEQIPSNIIRLSIDRIRRVTTYPREHLLKREGTKDNYKYEITNAGVEYVQNEIRRKESPIAYFHSNPDVDLIEIAGLDSDFMTASERQDANAWQPLKVDRQAPEYQEAINATEKAIDTIQNDNGFAASMPEERVGILQSLREGLDYLKNKTPTRQQVKSMLLAPLRWISSVFPQTVLGEAAKESAKALLRWLGMVS